MLFCSMIVENLFSFSLNIRYMIQGKYSEFASIRALKTYQFGFFVQFLLTKNTNFRRPTPAERVDKPDPLPTVFIYNFSTM